MMKYDRFTKHKIADGKGVYEKGVRYIEKLQSDTSILHRLAELEDKIENGTLIELPCKVGADVWGIIFQRDNFTDEPYRIVSRVAFKLSMLNDIGETVFLTREEAEKRLKELQE